MPGEHEHTRHGGTTGRHSGKRRGQGRCKRDVDVQDRLLSDRTETHLCGSAEAGLRHRRGTAEVQATSRPFTGGEPFGG
ncbi:hypothetical protein V1951_23710, partial [Yersinia sp. 2544 StPb PI]|uniref:hypothetical protein n=1 Tax=Yersinia sp. 2544 StPb PI TaxID=3117409 RepID=UPI003B280439